MPVDLWAVRGDTEAGTGRAGLRRTGGGRAGATSPAAGLEGLGEVEEEL